MLNEKLMEALNCIQGRINLDKEKKMAYVLVDNYGVNGCYGCLFTCTGIDSFD